MELRTFDAGPGAVAMRMNERLFNRLMVGVVLFCFLALMAVGGAAGWAVWRNQEYTG